MTDVDMSAPLPAVQFGQVVLVAHHIVDSQRARLAHLVQVLAVLPDDQRDAVLIETLRSCPVPKGERCVALSVALTGGPTAYGQLTAEANECRLRAVAAEDRAEQEKARADLNAAQREEAKEGWARAALARDELQTSVNRLVIERDEAKARADRAEQRVRELETVLRYIESHVDDDFTHDLDARLFASQTPRAEMTEAEVLRTAERFSRIYRATHAFNVAHSCHHVHKDWRAEVLKELEPK